MPRNYGIPSPKDPPKNENSVGLSPESGGWWVMILLTTSIVAAILGFVAYASARDLGQWEKMDPAQKAWFSQLMQLDTVGNGRIGVSCCGEADGYWADEVHVRDGKIFAVITDDRPDEPLMRIHEEPGTEYEVPAKKILGREQNVGNPTGHVVIFLGTAYWEGETRSKRPVLCYVPNAGV